jgi:hypothetical protein
MFNLLKQLIFVATVVVLVNSEQCYHISSSHSFGVAQIATSITAQYVRLLTHAAITRKT